ncbi:transglutaminase-like domain-containing protein [Nocardia crassostreae]|uniref:transglutaminase-like domain-containing protein n=1 Tax=Nocardia crassostreae TaxID=53428 RepID=UPI0009FC7A17|nr:transglutaminase family protein [Nocardia crassostreae]
MKRDVSAHLDVQVHAPTALELQIAVARQAGVDLIESLRLTLDGRECVPSEILGPHGTRLHRFDSGAGHLRVEYRATVLGAALAEQASDYDLAVYLRPSRFVESDKLLGFAGAEFGCGIGDPEMAARVSSWVGRRIRYVPGSSDPVDGAVETLLSGVGVCRDFSHLVVALLRAVGMPARVVSVYAPGCMPMDFHSVAEVYTNGGWQAFDPAGLAPRMSLVRIATGRDASDIAFLGNHGGDITLNALSVNATIDGPLPFDDLRQPAWIC